MSKFDGIENAKYTERGNYIQPGSHLFEIQGVKMIETRNKGDAFIAELLVHKSSTSKSLYLDPKEHENPEAHEVGQTLAWYVGMNQDSALGNIKGFIMAATGCKPNEVNAAGVDMIVSDKQPLKGAMIRCEAREIKTLAGASFTRCDWKSTSAVSAEKPAAQPAATA